MRVIEIDDPAGWPESLRRAASSAAASARGTTDNTVDLRLGDVDLWHLRDALAGQEVLVFHATRLLPHEVADIARDGLRALDLDLIVRKIDSAVARGHVTADDARTLLADHAKIDGSAGNRAGQVCATVSLRALDRNVHGVLPLLTQWGGEVIYQAHTRGPLARKLTNLGQPALVAFVAPALRDGDSWFPSIESVVVGAALGLPDANADVFVCSDVAPEDVRGVWAPGSPDYDAHPLLPRQ